MYTYICPKCGREFQSEHDQHYQCKSCGYWQLIVLYQEDNQVINKEAYDTTKRNFASNKKFELSCNECGKQAEFYCVDVLGLFCECGGFFREEMNSKEAIGKLKEYRKKGKLNQQQMADKLGVSKNYYASVEKGTRKANTKIIRFIRDNLSDPYQTIKTVV